MMTSPLFKIFRTLMLYYIFALLFSFVAAFVIKEPLEVLSIFNSSYFITRVFLYFTEILMAVQTSAILMAFAWYLKEYFEDATQLTYAVRSKIFSAVFIVLIFSTTFHTVMMEIVEPGLHKDLRSAEHNTQDYFTYMNMHKVLWIGIIMMKHALM